MIDDNGAALLRSSTLPRRGLAVASAKAAGSILPKRTTIRQSRIALRQEVVESRQVQRYFSAENRRADWAARRALTSEDFGALLVALDPADPDNAARRYGELHALLVRYLRSWDIGDPYTLADTVIDRIARRLAKGLDIANLFAFALSKAKWLRKEEFRKPEHSKRVDEISWNTLVG